MFYKESKSSNFITIRSMFIKSFKDIVNEFGLKLDPEESADIFIREHGFSEPYPYTKKFFEKVKDYIICLISDADFDMINPLLKKFNFDRIYISERNGKVVNPRDVIPPWLHKFYL